MANGKIINLQKKKNRNSPHFVFVLLLLLLCMTTYHVVLLERDPLGCCLGIIFTVGEVA